MLDKERILGKLEEHSDILKKYKVKKIGLFGSYVKGGQKKHRDIDFLVEFEEPNFDNFMDLVFFLEDLFNKKVDILTPEGVRSIRIKKVAQDIERNMIYV